MAKLRYKPSGKVSFWGIIKMLFWGTIGSGTLLSAYVYAIGWMPNLALRTIVLLLTAFLISRWMRRLTKTGKFRSPVAAYWLSHLAVLMGWYVHWAVYTVMVQDVWQYGMESFWQHHLGVDTLVQIGRTLIDPVGLWETICKIHQVGFWSLRGVPVQGTWLWVLWAAELLYFLIYPASKAVKQAKKLFSEERGVWLDQRIEFSIQYVKEHRIMRRKLIKGDLSSLDNIHYYQRQGRESHGIIVFHHHKGIMGPYVTIRMMKAVQIGPRRTKRYFIPIVKRWNIGSDKVEQILTRLVAERGTTHEKVTEKANWKDRYFWSNKREQITFAVQQSVEKARENSNQDTRYYGKGEKLANLDEVTVYAPTITPEMEKEYLEKKAREEQERIWAENREELKRRRKKSKRRSTRIK